MKACVENQEAEVEGHWEEWVVVLVGEIRMISLTRVVYV